MKFYELLRHRHPEDQLFLRNILFTDEVYFTRGSVLSIHNNQLWEMGNPQTIREHGCQVRFSLGGNCQGIVLAPYVT
jgi:hypothetical protein